MWDKRAKLIRVKDGDTLIAVLDQGFGETTELDLRLFGVWAPESSQKGGPETKAFVEKWFASLPETKWPFIVTTVRMKYTDKEQMSFSRYIGIVTSIDGSQNLNLDIQQFVIDHKYPGGTGS